MKQYLAHTKGKKDYMILEGNRRDFALNNMVIDFVITDELYKKFDNNFDCLIEYFGNVCNCNARTFTYMAKSYR